MRTIEIDEDIYTHLCSQTQAFGETPSNILRRLLNLRLHEGVQNPPQAPSSSEDSKSPNVGAETRSNLPAHGDPRSRKDLPRESMDDEVPDLTQGNDPLSQFIQARTFTSRTNALGRFLALLSWLNEQHGEDFGIVTSIHGRRRTFFAKSPEEIKKTGRSTMPRPIPGTQWHVATNNSTRMKQRIIKKVMTRLGYSKDSTDQAAALLEKHRSRRQGC